VTELLNRSFDYKQIRAKVWYAPILLLMPGVMVVSWLLFPNYGSHYDPRIGGLIIAFAAAIVAVVWKPQTLTRYRNA
jgi:hypothetical protein